MKQETIFSPCEEVLNDRNTIDHLTWTIENEEYLAHGNSKDRARGRSGHKNNNRIERNREGETWTQSRKIPNKA